MDAENTVTRTSASQLHRLNVVISVVHNKHTEKLLVRCALEAWIHAVRSLGGVV